MSLSIIGLIGGLALLIVLALRGMNLFLAGPICALIVALSGGIAIFDLEGTGSSNFVDGYMSGFSGFIADWFFMFLLGSLFGKLMEASGAAKSLSRWIILTFGKQYALLAVIGACALLTYGGVSVFIVAFSVYPMARSLFRDGGIPHRFIPATLAFGSATFTMTSAGSQEIQNWIPTKHLGTTPYAAWEVSLLVAIFIMVSGYVLLRFMIRRAKDNGEGFELQEEEGSEQESRSSEVLENSEPLPHPITAFVPLLMVLVTSFFTHKSLHENALIVALLVGCSTLAIINIKYIHDASKIVSDGALGALLAIGNTSAVVGFGTVVKLSPAFAVIVGAVTSVDGASLAIAALSITAVAGITGSASGGQAIVLPELAPHFLERGMAPENLHRITAIASGALDSMPHNGYVVTTIRVICKETHKTAYLPMAALTVVIPGLATCLAVFLMGLGL